MNMWYNIVIITVTLACIILLKQLFSSKPNKIKFNFIYFILYFGTSLATFLFLPMCILRPKDVRNATVIAKVTKHMTKLFGLRWELRNGHILAEDRGAVIVSNHQSSLDIFGMFDIWEVAQKLSVIAKKQLFYVWPFGLSAYLSGTVFIDRNNPKSAYKQIQVMSDVLVKNKTKLWIFPEGTRNKDCTKLMPFKRGAFKIAVNVQVPIIPVVFSPYYFINSKKYLFNKGHVIIKFLDPVPTDGLTEEDIPNLMNRIFEVMQTEYKKLSKEVIEALPRDYPLAVPLPQTDS